MAPGKHSEYGPSKMGALLSCLGRFQATKGMVGGGSSPAADRGTECHEWAEKLILDADAIVPAFKEDWQEDCTRDMVAHALDVYDQLTIFGDVSLAIEKEVNLGWLNHNVNVGDFDMSQVYGTCDVIMWAPTSAELVILDYKSGKGIAVDPENNVQMMCYALGALEEFKNFQVDKIRIVVSQPRVQAEKLEWYTTREELLLWVKDTLAPGLIGMTEPNAPFSPSKSACQWCPKAGVCPSQREEMLAMFDTPLVTEASVDDTPDAKILNDLLKRMGEFKQWMNQVTGAAQGMLEEGKDLPDFKLVNGRGSRGWSDPVAAEKFLASQKLKIHERNTLKLISPAQTEKVLKENLKRTITKNNFDKLVVKSVGKVTYALKSDKRDAVVVNKLEELVDLEDLF